MKKKLLIACMLGIVLSLGACGDAADKEVSKEIVEESDKKKDKESKDADSKDDKESKAPEGKDDDNKGSVSDATTKQSYRYLNVEFDTVYDSCYEDVSLMYGNYDAIVLNSKEFPALTAAVDAYNQEHSKEKQDELDEMEESARDEYKTYGAESFMGAYVAKSDMLLRRADNQVLSVVESCYSYYGGAHGNNYYTSINFDTQTGEQIELESVITDMNSLPKAIATELKDKYPDTGFWSDDLASLIQEYITPSSPDLVYSFTWTLDYQGVTFYFSDYELTSYAEGRQEVMLSYTEYPELLNSTYFENVDNHYVIELPDSWRGMDMDLNNDGVTDYISIQAKYNPEYYENESMTVTVNDNAYTLDNYFYEMAAYFVKSGDDNYLYVETISESDYHSVSVFKLTEISVEYMGYFGNGIANFTNSLNFAVNKRLDLLSTFFAMAECTMGEDGMPVETNPIYNVIGEMKLTSTTVIAAQLVDETGALLDTTYEFPAGTVFTLLATDGATYVDVMASDGQRCRFNTNTSWPYTVNGLDAESSFEMLYFAG